MEKLNFITFKQFIYTINIRTFIKELEDGNCIRIYYSDKGMDYKKDEWIDIAWNDFGSKERVLKNLSRILKEEVLNSYVTDFRFDEDIQTIVVYLEKEPNETLEEYQN